eukprot:7225821-Alexandrium_andersonii.AAC.1
MPPYVHTRILVPSLPWTLTAIRSLYGLLRILEPRPLQTLIVLMLLYLRARADPGADRPPDPH